MSLTPDDLTRLANNPVRGISKIVDAIERDWFNGEVRLNSKSHPFVFATDLILGTTHGLLNRVDDSISKLFPVHAKNISDLSRHMGEDEKVGLLANPSEGSLQLIIEEQTFMDISIYSTETVGRVSYSYNKLLIPKDTEVIISGYHLAIENGIEIRYNERTGYQVVYDESTNSFFNPIQDNILERELLTIGSRRYLAINVPVRQLKVIASENITSNPGSGCSGTLEYEDHLYGIKANFTANGVKKEILVSYNQDTFNLSTLTLGVILDTTNKTISYEIPEAYISNGRGIGILDIYIFTTKGELTKDFSNVNLDEVGVVYRDYRYGSNKLGEFSSKLRNSGGIAWKPIGNISGGSNPIPFETIKSNFINGRRVRDLPITENNLLGMVEGYGYSPIRSIDFTTGRKYNLTRELPFQDNKGFFSNMGCYVGSILTSAEELLASGLVYDHGTRITIPNNLLFEITQENNRLVNKALYETYLHMDSEDKVTLLREKTLVYNPFHYILDFTNDQSNLRIYNLDTPQFHYQTFKSENTALGIEVGVGEISIEFTNTGYEIELVTRSGKSYKDLTHESVGIQLLVKPPNSIEHATLRGELIGVNDNEERIFKFKLETGYDIDSNNLINITNLHQFGSVQPNTRMPLDIDLGFIFVMNGDKTETDTESDRKINDVLFPEGVLAIIETSYKVTLGKEFRNLYGRIRPVLGVAQYQQYQTDVYAKYDRDVLERDINGDIIFDNGVPRILHRAGETKHNEQGLPIIEHRAGDPVLGIDGEYIPLKARHLKYHWDFIGFDATYVFSKDSYDLEYAKDTKRYFTDIVDKDLTAFNERMLDQTDLVFQPKSKLGFTKVIVNSNNESFIKQDLSFTVTYYLTPNGFRNQNLKTSLQETVPRVINKELMNAITIGTGMLTEALKRDLATDVIDVKIDAIAGDTMLDVISNQSSLTGFGVRKSLRLTADGLLSIKEDIDVIFLLHGTDDR